MLPRDDIDVKYLKVWRCDVDVIKKHLSPEQVGLVLYYALEYAWNGEEAPDIPPELRFPYDLMKVSVDKSMNKYREVRATRAAAGAKGGNAKAANRKKAAEQKEAPTAWEPPTKKEFSAIASKAIKEIDNEWDVDDFLIAPDLDSADIYDLYNDLKSKGWVWAERPIENSRDLDHVIYDRFCPTGYRYISDKATARFIAMLAWKNHVDDFDFWDTYSEAQGGWVIGGNFYELSKAATAFAAAIDAGICDAL